MGEELKKMNMRQLTAYLDNAAEPLTVRRGEVYNAAGSKVAELIKRNDAPLRYGVQFSLFTDTEGYTAEVAHSRQTDKVAALISYGCEAANMELLLKGIAGALSMQSEETVAIALEKLQLMIEFARKRLAQYPGPAEL